MLKDSGPHTYFSSTGLNFLWEDGILVELVECSHFLGTDSDAIMLLSGAT